MDGHGVALWDGGGTEHGSVTRLGHACPARASRNSPDISRAVHPRRGSCVASREELTVLALHAARSPRALRGVCRAGAALPCLDCSVSARTRRIGPVGLLSLTQAGGFGHIALELCRRGAVRELERLRRSNMAVNEHGQGHSPSAEREGMPRSAHGDDGPTGERLGKMFESLKPLLALNREDLVAGKQCWMVGAPTDSNVFALVGCEEQQRFARRGSELPGPPGRRLQISGLKRAQ